MKRVKLRRLHRYGADGLTYKKDIVYTVEDAVAARTLNDIPIFVEVGDQPNDAVVVPPATGSVKITKKAPAPKAAAPLVRVPHVEDAPDAGPSETVAV